MPPPVQRVMGTRVREGSREGLYLPGSERLFICQLWQQWGSAGKYSSSGCFSWAEALSLSPCDPTGSCPCQGTLGAVLLPVNTMAVAGLWQPHSFPSAPLLTTSCCCKKKKLCCLFWTAFTPLFSYCRSYTKDNLCRFCSDPCSHPFPGLMPAWLAANTGALSFLLSFLVVTQVK